MDPAIGGIGGNGGIGPQRIQSDAQVMLAFTARFSSRLLGHPDRRDPIKRLIARNRINHAESYALLFRIKKCVIE
ncbi:hypothetical protein [Burkholderia cepacia]|uniref:hypothetical protein n=1 Tax=Burkholderia cepacia TaxID=292 RepID=UPI000F56F628|nr:hypothetical protein [Burkholderia cepacia]MCA8076640.1 hypothetical protein [Burkholderia cepacia]